MLFCYQIEGSTNGRGAVFGEPILRRILLPYEHNFFEANCRRCAGNDAVYGGAAPEGSTNGRGAVFGEPILRRILLPYEHNFFEANCRRCAGNDAVYGGAAPFRPWRCLRGTHPKEDIVTL